MMHNFLEGTAYPSLFETFTRLDDAVAEIIVHTVVNQSKEKKTKEELAKEKAKQKSNILERLTENVPLQ
jgi:hypothetical protein